MFNSSQIAILEQIVQDSYAGRPTLKLTTSSSAEVLEPVLFHC